jgi:transcriptional regulator with XRE-family HTH domain
MPSGPVRRPPHELAFVAAIRAAREDAGYTQADLATRAGLTVRALQRTERGQRRIAPGEAVAIAQALDRSLDELVKVSTATTFEPPKTGRARRADRPWNRRSRGYRVLCGRNAANMWKRPAPQCEPLPCPELLDADDLDVVSLITGVSENPVDHRLLVGAVGESHPAAVLVQYEGVDCDDHICVVVQDRTA